MLQNLKLYSRQGCHLCEEMEAALLSFNDELLYSVTVYDIDDDQNLFDRFNVLVPIVFKGDQEILRYHFELANLKSALTN